MLQSNVGINHNSLYILLPHKSVSPVCPDSIARYTRSVQMTFRKQDYLKFKAEMWQGKKNMDPPRVNPAIISYKADSES